MARDKGKLLQLITEEDFDPVEARINWLLEYFGNLFLTLRDDPEHPWSIYYDEVAHLFTQLTSISDQWSDLMYPEREMTAEDVVNAWLDNGKKWKKD